MESKKIKITLVDYLEEIQKFYGIQGKLAALFVIASNFSIDIAKMNKSRFPILYIHGKQGVGKSSFLKALDPLIGDRGMKQYNSITGSTVLDIYSKGNNKLIIFDEFTHSKPNDRLAIFLKNTYEKEFFYAEGNNGNNYFLKNSTVIISQTDKKGIGDFFTRSIVVEINKGGFGFPSYDIIDLQENLWYIKNDISNFYLYHNLCVFDLTTYLSFLTCRPNQNNIDNYALLLAIKFPMKGCEHNYLCDKVSKYIVEQEKKIG